MGGSVPGPPFWHSLAAPESGQAHDYFVSLMTGPWTKRNFHGTSGVRPFPYGGVCFFVSALWSNLGGRCF
jgi:hypothetical protein